MSFTDPFNPCERQDVGSVRWTFHYILSRYGVTHVEYLVDYVILSLTGSTVV